MVKPGVVSNYCIILSDLDSSYLLLIIAKSVILLFVCFLPTQGRELLRQEIPRISEVGHSCPRRGRLPT